MPRVRMKVRRPRFTFLSCAMWRISSSAESAAPGCRRSHRQAGCLQMRAHALRVLRRRKALGDGKIVRQHHADRDRLAMDEPSAS